MQQTFPRSIDELSPEWLGDTLGETVASYTCSALGEGVGLIAQLHRVELQTNHGPRTVIVKTPSTSPANRAVADMFDMYRREHLFYTDIAPHVPINAPRCHYSAFDERTRDFILVMEDVSKMRLGDQVRGCDSTMSHQVIEALASLAAYTWESERFPAIYRHDSTAQRQGMIAGFEGGWPAVLDKFGDVMPSEFARRVEVLPKRVDNMLEAMLEGPLCIAHGDARLDNMFFDDQGVTLLDFQAICRSAPEHDLAYFITQSLPDDVRRAEDWLAVYHGALHGKGIHYELETSMYRLRLWALYFLNYAVIICGGLDTNDRGARLGRTILQRAVHSIEDFESLELLERL